MHPDLVGERTQRIGGKHRSTSNNPTHHFGTADYVPRRLKEPSQSVPPRTDWPAKGDTGVMPADEVARLLAERARAQVAVPVSRPAERAPSWPSRLGALLRTWRKGGAK